MADTIQDENFDVCGCQLVPQHPRLVGTPADEVMGSLSGGLPKVLDVVEPVSGVLQGLYEPSRSQPATAGEKGRQPRHSPIVPLPPGGPVAPGIGSPDGRTVLR